MQERNTLWRSWKQPVHNERYTKNYLWISISIYLAKKYLIGLGIYRIRNSIKRWTEPNFGFRGWKQQTWWFSENISCVRYCISILWFLTRTKVSECIILCLAMYFKTEIIIFFIFWKSLLSRNNIKYLLLFINYIKY